MLISATGTGKTYASAFAMRELGFKRVLFVVHRNQIAKQAKESFENVFGNSIKSGYIAGIGNKEEGIYADYVFATVQSLTRNNLYTAFPKDYFDCCIYDESHHVTADSYQKLMEYFTPEFSLGMTATPDKRDDNIEGIGFAIPATTVDETVDGIVNGSAAFGITCGGIPEDVSGHYSIPGGVYVTFVQPKSDAHEKGIREGDIITAVNGKPVKNTDDVVKQKEGLKPGDTVTLTIWREGKTFDAEVILGNQNDFN